MKLKNIKIKLKNKTKKLVFKLLNMLFIVFYPLNKKRVVFLSDSNNQLQGNLKAMYDYLDKFNYRRILILRNTRKNNITITEMVKRIFYLSTSKFILLEDYVEIIAELNFKKNQEICQLWHGAGAFKKFGFANVQYKLGNMGVHKGYKKYTKVITSSPYIDKNYAEAFDISLSKISATGIPRTDKFFDNKQIVFTNAQLKKEYKIPENKKIILFSPTHRIVSFNLKKYDYELLNVDKLYENFNDDYVLLIKWHPMMKKQASDFMTKIKSNKNYNDFIYDFTDYPDINDLLFITDILITDYSSVIFEYALLNKPIIYFVYDLEEYEKDKGLFYPFKEYVYGKITKNFEELIKAIKQPSKYDIKRKNFLEKFMISCDGQSTKKVYKYIFEEDK